MTQNLHLCYSLNLANFFFGHNGKSAIEQVNFYDPRKNFFSLQRSYFLQESLTGLEQGLSSYIHNYAPAAVAMPCCAYGDYFAHPWATKIEYEDRHRELTQAVGELFKGEDKT